MTGSHRLIFCALLVMETAWWFTLAGMAGALLGLGGSPLSGVAVLALLMVAGVVSLALQGPHVDLLVAQGVSMLIALVAIYGAIAFSGGSSLLLGFQPLWLFDTLTGDSSALNIGRQVVGGLMGIGLWWRGMELGAAGDIDTVVLRSFRIGLVALVLGAVFDAVASVSLGMSWVAFAFFVAGLSALMLNQFQRESGPGVPERRWVQIALGVLGVVVLTGLLLSLATEGGPAAAASWLLGTVGSLLRGALLLIVTPLAYLMEVVVTWLQWLISQIAGEAQEGETLLRGALDFLEDLRRRGAEREVPGIVTAILTVLKWAFILYLVLLVLFLLYLAFVRGSRREQGVVRTAARGQTPLWQDMADLLQKLFPRIQVRGGEAPPPIPEGRDPRSALLRLYYTTLLRLEGHGLARKAFQTPLEYEGTSLAKALPGGVSRRLTRDFNGARYGNQVPPEEQVRRLESDVAQGMEEYALRLTQGSGVPPRPPRGGTSSEVQ